MELAEEAIIYTLRRIREDENIRYHMGAGTENFERLCEAYCAITGDTKDNVKKSILGTTLPRFSNAEKLSNIRDIVVSCVEMQTNPADAIKQVNDICRS